MLRVKCRADFTTPRKKPSVTYSDHPVAQMLLQELGEALFSSTLRLPGESAAMTDPYDIRNKLEHNLT